MRSSFPTSTGDIVTETSTSSSSWLGELRLESVSDFPSSLGQSPERFLTPYNNNASNPTRPPPYTLEKMSDGLGMPATSPSYSRSRNPLSFFFFTVPVKITNSLRGLLSYGNAHVNGSNKGDNKGIPSSSSYDIDSIKFVILCLLWYSSSAVTNNTGKQILNVFRFPVTLTFIQFGFVAAYCFIWANVLGFGKIRYPTRRVIETTIPLSLFQVVGHVFSSLAISRVPVSFVHTIKALSPLFTVGAYAFIFGVKYSGRTYGSLIPLTVGVMLACSFSSFKSTSNFIGFICALGSTIIFVSQNIFSKRLLFSDNRSSAHLRVKLDKINLLFYSSGMAFLLMIPLWMFYDGWILMGENGRSHLPTGSQSTMSIPVRFVINGTAHFGQNVIAFSILAITPTVTYSIASLIKRIFVIVASIIWFGQSTTLAQASGIGLTFIGLYMYNQAKSDVDRGERQLRKIEAQNDVVLPLTAGDERVDIIRDAIAKKNSLLDLDYRKGSIQEMNGNRDVFGYMNGGQINKPQHLGSLNGIGAKPAGILTSPTTTSTMIHLRENAGISPTGLATGIELGTGGHQISPREVNMMSNGPLPETIPTLNHHNHAEKKRIAPPPRRPSHPPAPSKVAVA